MRRSVIATVLLLFLLPLAGPAPAQSRPDAIPVKIAWQPGFIPHLYVGRDLRLFERAGLAPEYVKFLAGPAMLAALKTGSVDLAYMATFPFLAGLSQGLDVKVILVENDELTANGLIVRKDARIERLSDLAGKRIGVTNGTMAYYGLKRSLGTARLTDRDLAILNMGPTSWIPAFQKSDVDGLFVWAPWLHKIEAEGGKIVATLKDTGMRTAPDVWLARSEWLARNPEAVHRFIHGFDLAKEALRADPSRGPRSVAETVEIPIDVARRVYASQVLPTLEQMADPRDKYSLVSEAGVLRELKEQVEFMRAEDFIKAVPDVARAIDHSPLQRYLKAPRR